MANLGLRPLLFVNTLKLRGHGLQHPRRLRPLLFVNTLKLVESSIEETSGLRPLLFVNTLKPRYPYRP